MGRFRKAVRSVKRTVRKAYQAVPKVLGLRQRAAEYGAEGPQYSEKARSRSAGAGTVDFTEGAWS